MKTLILMKLAVLAFLSLDARAGVISAPAMRPFDEVLTEFKDRVSKNELPADVAEAGMNQMEIWTQAGGKVKSHRFDLAQVNRCENLGAQYALLADNVNTAALDRIRSLETSLDEANAEIAMLREQLAETMRALTNATTPAADHAEQTSETSSAPIDPTIAQTEIHPDGVSPSANPENGSPEDATTDAKESQPPASSEVASASAPASRKRGGSTA